MFLTKLFVCYRLVIVTHSRSVVASLTFPHILHCTLCLLRCMTHSRTPAYSPPHSPLPITSHHHLVSSHTTTEGSTHRARQQSIEEVHRSVAERSSANAREVKYMPDNIDLGKKGALKVVMCVVLLRVVCGVIMCDDIEAGGFF